MVLSKVVVVVVPGHRRGGISEVLFGVWNLARRAGVFSHTTHDFERGSCEHGPFSSSAVHEHESSTRQDANATSRPGSNVHPMIPPCPPSSWPPVPCGQPCQPAAMPGIRKSPLTSLRRGWRDRLKRGGDTLRIRPPATATPANRIPDRLPDRERREPTHAAPGENGAHFSFFGCMWWVGRDQ